MIKKLLFFSALSFLSFFIFVLSPAEAQGFEISFTPNSSSIIQGEYTSAAVNITGQTEHAVALAVSQGKPDDATVRFSPSSCQAPCSSVMTITTESTVAPGTYSIVVLGTSEGQTVVATYTLTVTALPQFDFSISLTSTSGSLLPGGKQSTTINLSQLSGTSKKVYLSVSGNPTGTTVSLSPSYCTPPCNSVMTISTSATAASGTYSITISAVSGGLTKSASFTLTIATQPLNFALALNSTSGSIAQGENINVSLNLTLLSGTSQNINLNSSGQPAGVTIKFNPSYCKAPCSSVMTISVLSTAVSGTHPITISAVAGGLTTTANYSLTIASLSQFNFSLSLSPNSGMVVREGSVSSTLNLIQVSGTSQNVVLTVSGQPAGSTIKLSPTSCKPPCSSVMTISTKSNIAIGNYPITIIGTAGGLTKIANYNLTAVAKLPTLTAPNLVSPAPNVRVANITPLLDWTDVPEAGAYFWEIQGVTSGTSFVSSAIVPSGILAYNTFYIWKVKACIDSSLSFCGPWSKERVFYTPLFDREARIRELQVKIAAILAEIIRLQNELMKIIGK